MLGKKRPHWCPSYCCATNVMYYVRHPVAHKKRSTMGKDNTVYLMPQIHCGGGNTNKRMVDWGRGKEGQRALIENIDSGEGGKRDSQHRSRELSEAQKRWHQRAAGTRDDTKIAYA